MLDAAGLASVVADVLVDPLSSGPDFLASLVVVAKFFLGGDLVLDGAFLEAVDNGGHCAASPALLLQRQAVAVLVRIKYSLDFGEAVLLQPRIEGLDERVGVRLLRAGVSKKD